MGSASQKSQLGHVWKVICNSALTDGQLECATQGSRGSHNGHPPAAAPSLVGCADQGIRQPGACLRAHEGLFRCAPQAADTPRGPRVARGGCYCRGGWRGWSLHRSTGVSLCRHAVILLVQEMGEKTGAGHGPRARGLHLFSVQDPEDAVCGLVPGLWKGKGPVSGVRDFRLHDPRQVTPLEPHFRHL